MEVVHNPCRAQPAVMGCVRLFVDSSTSLEQNYCAVGNKEHSKKLTGKQPQHFSTENFGQQRTSPSETGKPSKNRAIQERPDEKGIQLSKLQQWQQQRSASLQQLEHRHSSDHAWYRSLQESQVHKLVGKRATNIHV